MVLVFNSSTIKPKDFEELIEIKSQIKMPNIRAEHAKPVSERIHQQLTTTITKEI